MKRKIVLILLAVFLVHPGSFCSMQPKQNFKQSFSQINQVSFPQIHQAPLINLNQLSYNRNFPYNPVFPYSCNQIKQVTCNPKFLFRPVFPYSHKQIQQPPCFPGALMPSKNGSSKCALFAPDDNIMRFLIGMIKNEQESIKMAAYLLTNYDVATELMKAKNRGINTAIIFDETKAIPNNVSKLANSGIDIYMYKANGQSNDKLSNVMHNKFIVFGLNVFARPFVWTGSFNFTNSAYKSNHENVVILDDEKTVNRFSNQFEKIKKLCYKVSKK